jgi:hypothetical protein
MRAQVGMGSVAAPTALEFRLGFPVFARYKKTLAAALRGIMGIYQDHPYPPASALYWTNCFSSSKLRNEFAIAFV